MLNERYRLLSATVPGPWSVLRPSSQLLPLLQALMPLALIVMSLFMGLCNQVAHGSIMTESSPASSYIHFLYLDFPKNQTVFNVPSPTEASLHGLGKLTIPVIIQADLSIPLKSSASAEQPRSSVNREDVTTDLEWEDTAWSWFLTVNGEEPLWIVNPWRPIEISLSAFINKISDGRRFSTHTIVPMVCPSFQDNQTQYLNYFRHPRALDTSACLIGLTTVVYTYPVKNVRGEEDSSATQKNNHVFLDSKSPLFGVNVGVTATTTDYFAVNDLLNASIGLLIEAPVNRHSLTGRSEPPQQLWIVCFMTGNRLLDPIPFISKPQALEILHQHKVYHYPLIADNKCSLIDGPNVIVYAKPFDGLSVVYVCPYLNSVMYISEHVFVQTEEPKAVSDPPEQHLYVLAAPLSEGMVAGSASLDERREYLETKYADNSTNKTSSHRIAVLLDYDDVIENEFPTHMHEFLSLLISSSSVHGIPGIDSGYMVEIFIMQTPEHALRLLDPITQLLRTDSHPAGIVLADFNYLVQNSSAVAPVAVYYIGCSELRQLYSTGMLELEPNQQSSFTSPSLVTGREILVRHLAERATRLFDLSSHHWHNSQHMEYIPQLDIDTYDASMQVFRVCPGTLSMMQSVSVHVSVSKVLRNHVDGKSESPLIRRPSDQQSFPQIISVIGCGFESSKPPLGFHVDAYLVIRLIVRLKFLLRYLPWVFCRRYHLQWLQAKSLFGLVSPYICCQ
jgi:hypothetical protein